MANLLRYVFVMLLALLGAAWLDRHHDVMVVKRQLFYEAQLVATLVRPDRAWWNEIGSTGVFLGAQPQYRLGHKTSLAHDLRINAVVTLLEDFEAEPGLWRHDPVTAREWHSLGVATHWVVARDHLALNVSQLDSAVQRLILHVAMDDRVYVHCKAGVGRSAQVVLAFLVRARQWPLERALGYLSAARPCVNIDAERSQAVLDYVAFAERRDAVDPRAAQDLAACRKVLQQRAGARTPGAEREPAGRREQAQ